MIKPSYMKAIQLFPSNAQTELLISALITNCFLGLAETEIQSFLAKEAFTFNLISHGVHLIYNLPRN